MTFTENTSYICCARCGYRLNQLAQDWCWRCDQPPVIEVKNPTLDLLTSSTESDDSLKS